MIDFNLRDRLVDATPAAVASGNVYVQSAQQNDESDRVVLKLLPGGIREYHTAGATNLVEALIRVDIFTAQYEDARTIYDAIRAKVDGVGGTTWGDDSVAIESSFLSPPSDESTYPIFGDEVGQPTLRSILTVRYRET